MEVLNCHIVIGKYTFDYVHKVDITSSWMQLTDGGTITLPANLRLTNNQLKQYFKKGDAVEVFIGYESFGLTKVFEGFLTRIHPTVPIVLDVEDLMWKLKQIQVNDTAKNETIGSFLSRVLPYEIDAFEIDLPRFIASKITGAQLLEQIKSDFGLSAFVRNGKVVVGKQYDPENTTHHIFELDNNVLTDQLEFVAKEDVKLKITAISNNADGTKTEITLGETDGEERSLNFYNLSKADLKALAEKEMQRLVYDGYRGTITAFGEPIVMHGDIVELRNSTESDKTGNYYVDGVVYRYGIEGVRQEITLGSRT